MVDSRAKGARAELQIRDKLRDLTGHKFERTPSSGALSPALMMKGDLFIPNVNNLYSIEVKHYENDQFTTSIYSAKEPTLFKWWDQAIRQANQTSKKPLLIFKHDRSKNFVAFKDMPDKDFLYTYINYIEPFYVALLEDWYNNEQPKFI